MTRDDVLRIALAAKAGVYLPEEDGLPGTWVGQDFDMLERFAALAVEHERSARIAAQVENEALKARLAGSGVAEPVQDPCAELIDYILQDDIHNRLTPRVVDIAYSAFMLAKQGKNKDDGGICDWFNDTKPMVMEQLAKIKKDLASEAPQAQPAPVQEPCSRRE